MKDRKSLTDSVDRLTKGGCRASTAFRQIGITPKQYEEWTGKPVPKTEGKPSSKNTEEVETFLDELELAIARLRERLGRSG